MHDELIWFSFCAGFLMLIRCCTSRLDNFNVAGSVVVMGELLFPKPALCRSLASSVADMDIILGLAQVSFLRSSHVNWWLDTNEIR